VTPSGECLRGDGWCADRIVSNFSAVVLAAYLPVLNPAVGCTWPACHDIHVYSAVLRISCCTSQRSGLRIIRLMIWFDLIWLMMMMTMMLQNAQEYWTSAVTCRRRRSPGARNTAKSATVSCCAIANSQTRLPNWSFHCVKLRYMSATKRLHSFTAENSSASGFVNTPLL